MGDHADQNSSAIRKRLDDCFARGKRLSAERDYDYAHAMFAECVLHEPAKLAYVEALLHNLRQKFPKAQKKVLPSGRGVSKEIVRAQRSKRWLEVLRHGVDLLKDDPWNTWTLRALAEACAHSHFNEVELAHLKQALDVAPKDVEVNRH